MLAMADETGFVPCSLPGLMRSANIPQEAFIKALKTLESPDEFSRTNDYDGRRVEKIEGGWIILNYIKYREREDRDKHREYMRKWRENKDCESQKLTVNHSESQSLTVESHSASASASASVSKDGDYKGKDLPLWRKSFDIYTDEISKQWSELISDYEWLEERQKYHPRLNIRLSLEKAMNDFWGTEAGWTYKKKSKAKNIDLKATLNNALTMKSNQVWMGLK
jgi:hypothetical protein